MGLIRKSISVSTLGLVPYRSRKEKLRRAEKAQRKAEAYVEGLDHARTVAETRRTAAEKQLQKVRAEAARANKKLERRGRRRRRAEGLADLIATAEPMWRDTVHEAAAKGRRARRRARKTQAEAAKTAKAKLRKARGSAAEAVGTAAAGAHHLAERAEDAVEQLTSH